MDSVLPTITWSGQMVHIDNIRDHHWTTDTDFSPDYLSGTFDINQVEKLFYVITPFSSSDGPAHTMFVFTFSDGRSVVISPEVRKERGEKFDAISGILNQYELQYVIATENDVLRLRTDKRKNEVYMYPIRTDISKIQQLFRSMLLRGDKLAREPEFYNTLWNNCATSILFHTNSLRIDKLSAGKYILLPSHSDEIIYQAGLINTTLSLAQARTHFRIDERARSYTGTDFPSFIHSFY